MENPGNRADKLIERILGEAEADASAAREKAAEGCRAVIADCEKKIAERATVAAAARDIAVKGVLDGARTRAELDGRKETLSVRRRILDEAFAAATKELNALTGPRREAILLSLLKKEAAAGDVVEPAKQDRAVIEKLLPQVPVKLTLSEKDAPCEGGFLLQGGSYEKDCSLDALMAELRLNEETNAARILFT
jgi:vacuolar-type H+-ATPase subunit E/Vma4